MAENGDIRGETALIIALARGESQRDVAKASGVSVRTITRRMSDPGFVATVQLERARLTERAIGRLADAAARFADVLQEVAEDQTAPPSARVSAARAGLEFGARVQERGAGEDWFAPLVDPELEVIAQIRADIAKMMPHLAVEPRERRHFWMSEQVAHLAGACAP